MIQNIVFCASPEFAIPALDACIQLTQTARLTVLSQPDKIRTRGKKTTPTPIRQHALNHNLATHTPQTKEEFSKLIITINPDLVIVIAYGMIIPKTITDHYLCINAHASLLPQYRGASPIQTALLNNDTQTGITLIKMNEKMDEGPIITQKKQPIAKGCTFNSLHDDLALLTATMINSLLIQPNITQQMNLKQQNHTKATYCHKITKEELYLNPKDSIKTNLAKIKAFSPKPSAYTFCNHKRLKIIDAKIDNQTLIPLTVQPEGKKPMSYQDFRKGNGFPLDCE